MSVSVLVVSDHDGRHVVTEALRAHGFRTIAASDVATGQNLSHAYSPALVIIDAALPADGALDLLRLIRSTADTPVIVLAHVADDVDDALALAEGADDFIVWPTSTRVLVSRVTALLRRASGAFAREDRADRLMLDGLVVSRSSRSATVGGVDLHLTRTEFDLLLLLMQRPQRVLRRDEIARSVWGDGSVGDHVIEVHVSRLRSKIAKAGGPSIAESVRGVGYRLQGHATSVGPV